MKMRLRFTLIALFSVAVPCGAAPALTLTPVVTGLTTPIGIAPHGAGLLLSLNYPTGLLKNLAAVAPDGSIASFSALKGMGGKVEVALSPGGGGFAAGDYYLANNGAHGQIAKVSGDGKTIVSPWATLPGEFYAVRSLTFDTTGVFGNLLIVVTEVGHVWAVYPNGTALGPQRLGDPRFGEFTDGAAVIPNDARYGPWAGAVLTCANNRTPSLIYAVTLDSQYNVHVTTWNIGIPFAGGVSVVLPQANLYLVDYGCGIPGWGQVLGAPAASLAPYVGELVVPDVQFSVLWHVRWNGTSFDKEVIASVPGGELQKLTFTKAGIGGIPTAP